MYNLARALLFKMDPESAHHLTLKGLSVAERLGLIRLLAARPVDDPVEIMGLRFPNPVGLAAGLDKNGDHIDALGALGFGFIEVGTVTPRAQQGNPKPRLFRLPEYEAIINRMGFNNEGLSHLLEKVRSRRYEGILGINVGKNFDTPVEQAEVDYRKGIAAVYACADYITVNVSSPNTPGLRDLQFGDQLKRLLQGVKEEQRVQAERVGRYVPIAVKIAPDMDDEAIRFIASTLLETGMDAVIATNTTIDRQAIAGHALVGEAGGLSGKPLRKASTKVIRHLSEALSGRLPIIGVGGITDGASAAEKIQAGASLVQIYTGFIYRGPALVREAAQAIAALPGRQSGSSER
ncbi:quinone-dependent dihydroorotate dehydrogenase [Mangrovitalea sediminis]|uniref:quinone-dependent dihydroorotate dehydrogenase n=1 Tax=Mangrovitalea sediminis TaxID=1982043 RepID=UPI000BE4FDF0|nr:quinone-dependent dihydroorotate dehydrogenase [Mangrovitalea sediminis]